MTESQHARILIVDDQEINIRILQRILEKAGYRETKATTEPHRALQLFSEVEPDLVLLDLMMPEMDGFDVMRELHERVPTDDFLPIVVLTADTTPESKRRALDEGAHDFLTKPFDHAEVLLRIRNQLQTRLLYHRVREQNALLARQNEILDQRVLERTRELDLAQRELVSRLAQANEFRDDHTGAHIHRVGRMAALLAQRLGLPEVEVETIRQAATLHDVGKIAVADRILLKTASLDDEERDAMKQHTVLGAELLADGHSEVMQMAERIASSHHERWDGDGYPNRLHGEQIPLEGRIVSVIDVFDALAHERPYKPAWPVSDALAEIQRQSGRQFDPRIVDAFLSLPHDALL